MPFQFPPYRPPIGGPHFWKYDYSGRLPAAVTAYLENRVRDTPISPDDCELVAAYVRHWIHAPMYDANPYHKFDPHGKKILAELRAEAAALTDADSIDRWIHKALGHGIDPL